MNGFAIHRHLYGVQSLDAVNRAHRGVHVFGLKKNAILLRAHIEKVHSLDRGVGGLAVRYQLGCAHVAVQAPVQVQCIIVP